MEPYIHPGQLITVKGKMLGEKDDLSDFIFFINFIYIKYIDFIYFIIIAYF